MFVLNDRKIQRSTEMVRGVNETFDALFSIPARPIEDSLIQMSAIDRELRDIIHVLGMGEEHE
jgi:hypothetical protein|tara:strand:- start:70 stop:258 length:189 start_codon:yes stop_codon:yes gene_type:complete